MKIYPSGAKYYFGSLPVYLVRIDDKKFRKNPQSIKFTNTDIEIQI
jgi:hypothetical protein